MKTTNLLKAIVTLAVAGSMFSCSKGSKSNDVAAGAVSVSSTGVSTYDGDPGTGFVSSSWPDDGATAVFTPKNLTTMNSWVGLHPLNAPKNYRIRINLEKVLITNSAGATTGGPYYAGNVSIGYTDTGVWYTSTLSAGNGYNVKCTNCNDNGALEAKYNYFYKQSDGSIVFSGFFQDQYGGIVIVLKPSSTSGADAEGSKTWDGKVFYRNFAQSTLAQSPYRKCWFITNGPYLCNSATVMNKTGIDTIANYTYLGSFSGLTSGAVITN